MGYRVLVEILLEFKQIEPYIVGDYVQSRAGSDRRVSIEDVGVKTVTCVSRDVAARPECIEIALPCSRDHGIAVFEEDSFRLSGRT